MMRRLQLCVAPAVCATLVVACSPVGSLPVKRTSASMADSAEQVMLNVRSLLTERGVARGEMFADSAYIFDENTRFELRKVRVTFNTVTGARDGTMSATRGRYSTRMQVLEGFGNVIVTTNEGKRLTSPHLRYDQAINQVSSDTSFTMVEPGRTVSGIGFRSDPQLAHVVILKAAHGEGSFTLPGT